MENPERRIITIASCLRAPEQGDEFTTWPYHVTIVPPFLADEYQVHDIATEVDHVAKSTASFEIQGGNDDIFSDREVRRLTDPRPFEALHRRLVPVVTNNGGELLDDTYVGPNYTPHVSVQKRPGWLTLGEKRMIPGIDMVWRDPSRNNLKIVLAHYAFTGWTRLD